MGLQRVFLQDGVALQLAGGQENRGMTRQEGDIHLGVGLIYSLDSLPFVSERNWLFHVCEVSEQ